MFLITVHSTLSNTPFPTHPFQHTLFNTPFPTQVPDIYDAVKYDAIHNAHLGLDLEDLYTTAKSLADTVIPNEYGLTPDARLHIGSSICSQLLGKILADMHNMKEESLATAGINEQVCGGVCGCVGVCVDVWVFVWMCGCVVVCVDVRMCGCLCGR